MLDARFVSLPETFLVMYREPLMAWARKLGDPRARDRKLSIKIDLMRPPGASVLHVDGVAPEVTLVCEPQEKGEFVRLVIRPASQFDAEVIAKHCEELPKMRIVANDNLPRKARKQVSAEFDQIPEEFVQWYSAELHSWGGQFAARGPNYLIMLRRIMGKPYVLDENGEIPQIGVRLSAKVDRARKGDNFLRLIISPETEDDRRKIANHVADIAKFGPPVSPVGRPKSRASMEVPGVN